MSLNYEKVISHILFDHCILLEVKRKRPQIQFQKLMQTKYKQSIKCVAYLKSSCQIWGFNSLLPNSLKSRFLNILQTLWLLSQVSMDWRGFCVLYLLYFLALESPWHSRLDYREPFNIDQVSFFIHGIMLLCN